MRHRYVIPKVAPPPPREESDVEKQLLRQIAAAEQQKQEAVFTLEALRRGHQEHRNVSLTLR